MPEQGKRKMVDRSDDRSSKRKKGGDRWRKQKGGQSDLESGDSGVFLTCDIGNESKGVAEALDLFSQSIEAVSGEHSDNDDGEDDIEAQIRKEVEGLQPKSSTTRLFKAIKFDVPCLSFIRVDKSIDPVQLVHGLCTKAQVHPEQKKCRWIRRMTPITSIRKTLSVDLHEFATEILRPHFHAGGVPKKFAIRPSVRNNGKFSRDAIIETVADAVGGEHSVDLKNYDLMILVDVFQNIIGMSVVGNDYDTLKRFNIAEIYSPTPKPEASR